MVLLIPLWLDLGSMQFAQRTNLLTQICVLSSSLDIQMISKRNLGLSIHFLDDSVLWWPAVLLKRQNVEGAADCLESVCSIFNYLNQFPRYSIARQNLKLSMNIADVLNFEKFSFLFPNFDNPLAHKMMFITKCSLNNSFNLNLTPIKASKQFSFSQHIEYKW